MSRNWVLAMAAAAVWVGAYGWYFIGIGKLRATWRRTLQRIGVRRGDDAP